MGIVMSRCIIDIKTGKALPWAAIQTAAYSLLDAPVLFVKQGHLYTAGGISLESVTGILKAEGLINTKFYTDEGRERGSYVHKVRYLDDSWQLGEGDIDSSAVPYVAAWRKFKQESGFVVEKSETPMMSAAYRYAGTPDAIGHFPDGRIKRAAVELHNDGTYKLIPYTDRQDVAIWLSVLAVHNWKINNLRR